MPVEGRWKEITLILHHLTQYREECAHFSYRDLTEFLLRAESYVDHFGLTSRQRNVAAVQIVRTHLIHPAVSQRLPTTVAQRSQLENRQMRRLFAQKPQTERYKRVSIMWLRWMDAYGTYYP